MRPVSKRFSFTRGSFARSWGIRTGFAWIPRQGFMSHSDLHPWLYIYLGQTVLQHDSHIYLRTKNYSPPERDEATGVMHAPVPPWARG